MKKILVLFSISITLIFARSCSNEKGSYVDLRTGKSIAIEKDSTGAWIEAGTKQPVYIYVDTKRNDTIYGKTGEVINGHVVKGSDNVYFYDMDVNSTNSNNEAGDYKRKVENDGDVKIKTDDKKIKIDGETGERKVKND